MAREQRICSGRTGSRATAVPVPFATTHGATADARLCLPSGRVKELVAVTSQTTPTPRGGSGLDLAVNRRVFGNVNVTVNVDVSVGLENVGAR